MLQNIKWYSIFIILTTDERNTQSQHTKLGGIRNGDRD